MKKLNITKEQYNKSRYFNDKYGKLEYVSESGDVYKTDKGKILMFKESGTMRPMDDKPNTDIFKSWAELEREIDASIRYAKNKDQNACSIIEIGTWDQRNNPNLKKIMNKFKEKGYNCSVQPGYFDDDTDDGDIGMTMTIEWSRFLESSKKFGKKFSESYTDMSAIEEKLAAALDEEIRSMTPDDIQGVYESAKDDEMAVSTIFVLLQQAFASRKFTDEEKKKLLNADPKIISAMVLDIIDHSLPQSKGALVLVLGMAREAVKEMSDQDWKDIVEYALNNPDNL